MTSQEWRPIYERLCGALERKPTPAQERAYFDALSSYPVSVVADACRQAASRTWPPTHPHAGEIVELAASLRRARTVSAAACDVCAGDKFQQWHCAGVTAPDAQTKPYPVDRSQYCGRDWVHADHAWATTCPQCHPVSRAQEA